MTNNNFEFLMCKSGWGVSVQAQKSNYCTPRETGAKAYTHVELGFPTAPEPLIAGFADQPDNPTETVYGYVPVGIVQAVIVKHGGIESGEHPPFQLDANQAAIMAEAMQQIEEEVR